MENNPNETSFHGGSREPLRTIALEEHFASPKFLEGPGQGLIERVTHVGRFKTLVEDLADLGEKRIGEMDAAGIDVQVLTLTDPGVQALEGTEAMELAQEANNFVFNAIQTYPERFAGFASLPISDPEAAANELERTVKENGFKGGLINGHCKGRYLDDNFFWPILERAASLNVPLYIHPTPPPQPVIDAYYSGFSPEVTYSLSTNGWGWHIETAVHILRLIFGGVFDQFPNLQIIIGHLGEALPFMLPRLDRNMNQDLTKLNRSVAAYLRENVYYTFSGFNFIPTFLDLYLQVGAERIIFSTDYPYASMAEARAFLDKIPVCSADKQRIAHGNAEKLLNV